MKTLAK